MYADGAYWRDLHQIVHPKKLLDVNIAVSVLFGDFKANQRNISGWGLVGWTICISVPLQLALLGLDKETILFHCFLFRSV